MNPDEKIIFMGWYTKTDPPIWIAADLNVKKLVHGPQQNKTFVSKPVAVSCNSKENFIMIT